MSDLQRRADYRKMLPKSQDKINAKNLPLVTILILNHDGGKVTEACVKSVSKSRYPNFEIILVDNGSSKNEIEKLKKLHRNGIRVILSKTNLGYAEGNNFGASKARGKYIVFLNNDIIVSSDWLEKPIQRMEQNPQIALLQPKIRWLKNKKFFEYCGGCGGFLDYFGFLFVRGRIFGSIEEDLGQYDDEREVFWASGAALFCRRKVFEKLGRFDSYFFTQVEDEDLCFRAHRSGYKVIYFPKSLVFHLGSYTGDRNIFKKTFFNYRNHLILLTKNLKVKEMISIFPVKLFFDMVAIVYYPIRFKNWALSMAILAAYFSFLKNFPTIWRRRYLYDLENFGYPRNPRLIYKGSIILQYYILKKKRWSEIFGKTAVKSKVIEIF